MHPHPDKWHYNRLMELSETKIEQLNKQPVLETQITKSKGWIIHKTIITDLKPVSYLQKVMDSKEKTTNKK